MAVQPLSTSSQIVVYNSDVVLKDKTAIGNHQGVTVGDILALGGGGGGTTLAGLATDVATQTFTFDGNDVLFGTVTLGAIPVKATVGVVDSGFYKNWSPGAAINNLGDGFQYYSTGATFAPAGYPELMTSTVMGGLVVYGPIMSDDGQNQGEAAFGSAANGGYDIAHYQGMITNVYQYGSGNLKLNPVTQIVSFFDYLGSGQFVFDAGAGECRAPSFVPTSDRKLKDNIEGITDGLAVVMQLQGSKYTLKATGTGSSGFIAQEVQEVIPDSVSDVDGTLGVNYNSIIAYQNEAIKELKGMIDALQLEIESLKK